MLDSFVMVTAPSRVVFGAGTLSRLGEEVERLGHSRVLVLSTPQQAHLADQAASLLGPRAAGRFIDATMHTPIEVTDRAMAVVRDLQVDAVLSVGGGSTIGLGKAIALRTDLPQIVVPTTYAGSEMTDLIGETQNGVKNTQRTPRVRPEVVIYDVELTRSLPVPLSVVSGFNAIAHAVEALYAPDGNPIISLVAEEGVRSLAKALPDLVADGSDMTARAGALRGAWMCGICLGSVNMALHHKLCHTLGGLFDLPHAETHAVLLPYTLDFNAKAVPHAIERLARALDAVDPAAALRGLGLSCGIPPSLGAIGLQDRDLDRAADVAANNPYWNPRPIDRDSIRLLLAKAQQGV